MIKQKILSSANLMCLYNKNLDYTNQFKLTVGRGSVGGTSYGYGAADYYGSITDDNRITPWKWFMRSIRASTSTKSLMFGFRVGKNPVSEFCPGTKDDNLWNLYTWKITIGDKTSTFDYLNNHTVSGGVHEWWFETRNVRDWDVYLSKHVGETLDVKIDYIKK